MTNKGEVEVSEKEQCPHCKKMVADVYLHTAHEDCDVINEQIAQLIAEGVSEDFKP